MQATCRARFITLKYLRLTFEESINIYDSRYVYFKEKLYRMSPITVANLVIYRLKLNVELIHKVKLPLHLLTILWKTPLLAKTSNWSPTYPREVAAAREIGTLEEDLRQLRTFLIPFQKGGRRRRRGRQRMQRNSWTNPRSHIRSTGWWWRRAPAREYGFLVQHKLSRGQ